MNPNNTMLVYPCYMVAFAAGIGMLMLLSRLRIQWRSQAIAGILISALMAVYAFKISDPRKKFSDFHEAYYPAGKAILIGDKNGGMATTIETGVQGFVNLPVVAYLFAPFAMLPTDSGPLPSLLAARVFFLLGIGATIVVWYLLCRLADLNRERSLILLFLFAACGPLHYSLRIGNTVQFILLLIVLGMWALRRDKQLLAGLIFGFAALIKLPLLLLGVYFAARGKWRVSMGGAIICGLAGISSILLFGWDLHVVWYEYSIKPYSETPMAAFNVQSVQSFLARIQHGGQYLWDWETREVNHILQIASKVSVGFLLGGVAVLLSRAAIMQRRRLNATHATAIHELEICIVVLLSIIISTVSWSHYHTWMLLPAAFVLGRTPPVLGVGGFRILGWVAIFGAMLPVKYLKIDNPMLEKFYAYFAVSNYFISAVILLGVLLAAVWQSSRDQSAIGVNPNRLNEFDCDQCPAAD